MTENLLRGESSEQRPSDNLLAKFCAIPKRTQLQPCPLLAGVGSVY